MAKKDGILWSVDIDTDEETVIESGETSSTGKTADETDPTVTGKEGSDKRELIYPGWGYVPDTGANGGSAGIIYNPPQYVPLPPVPQTEYVTVIRTHSEPITDFSQETIDAYIASGAYPVRIYEDGYAERVEWSDISDPHEVVTHTLDMMDAEARRLVGEVSDAVNGAVARLDEQAGLIDEAKGTITSLEEDITDFKETADVKYAYKEDFDPTTGSYTKLIAANYATKDENLSSTKSNLSPFYDNDPLDVFSNDRTYGYWSVELQSDVDPLIEYKGNGWVHVYWDNRNSQSARRYDHVVKQFNNIEEDTDYTFLMEVRNNRSVGDANNAMWYIVQNDNRMFWGGGVKKVIESSANLSGSWAGVRVGCGVTASHRFVKTSEKADGGHWPAQAPDGLLSLVFYAASGTLLDFECRISMYKGEYLGEYKPFVSPKTTLATKHEVEETADSFRRTISEEYATIEDVTNTTSNLATKSEVQQMAGQITQTVSQKYATKDEVAAIEVGASNLIQKTGETEPYSLYTNNDRLWVMANTYGSFTVNNNIFTYTRNSSGLTNRTSGLRLSCVTDDGLPGYSNAGQSNDFGIDMAAGDTYTYSVDVKTTGNRVALIPQYYNGSNVWSETGPKEFTPADSDWHRYSATFTLPQDFVCFTALVVACENTEGVVISSKNYKLERGGVATDWTPHPLDLLSTGQAAAIYTSKTEFQQTTDAISLRAEAALRRDPTNMLLDWNAVDSDGNPTLSKIDGPANRYFADTNNVEISTELFKVVDPPDPSILSGARFTCNGSNTKAMQRALGFYTAVDFKSIPYKANQDYTMSVWVRRTSGNASSCQVRFAMRGSSTSTTPGTGTVLYYEPVTDEWSRVSHTFRLKSIPSDYCRVFFGARFEANTQGTIELCGFKMVPGKNADVINDQLTNYMQRSEFTVEKNQITSSVSDALVSAKDYTDQRETAILQTAGSIVMSSEARTSNIPNLEPYFAHPLDDFRGGEFKVDEYWRFDHRESYGASNTVQLEDGWVAVTRDNSSGDSTFFVNIRSKANANLKENTNYTALLEVRNCTKTGTITWRAFHNRTSESNPTISQFPTSVTRTITGNGLYRATANSRTSFDGCTESTSGYITIPAGAKFKAEIRVSLYESPSIYNPDTKLYEVKQYEGPYKPYVPTDAMMYETRAAVTIGMESISSEVSATKESLKGITAGGLNMLKDTNVSSLNKVLGPANRYFAQSNLDGAGSIVSLSGLPDGLKYATRFTIPALKNNVGYTLCWYSGSEIPMVNGTEYTVSFWGRVTSGSAKGLFELGTSKYILKDTETPLTGSWARYSLTLTYEDSTTGGSGKTRCYVGVRCTSASATVAEICGVKLEQGSIASAYEETISDVSEVSSKITQTAQDVTTLFTNSSAGVDISYYSHTSATSAPADSVAWQSNMPARAANRYIWMKVTTKKYNADHGVSSTTTKTCISGVDGVNGTNGTNGTNGVSPKWYTGTAITGTSTSATIFSGSGITSAVVGDMYLNTSTANTYRCTVAGNASTAKWIYASNIKGATGAKGDKGATGAAGADGDDGRMLYATCATAAGTADKVCNLVGGTLTLTAGAIVTVIFTNKNTATANMRLNIGGTGLKNARAYNQYITATSLWRLHEDKMAVTFVYDGTYWIVADAAAMHSYIREDSSGLIVGTNYQKGYSYVANGGGFYVMQKATATAGENINADSKLASFTSSSFQIGLNSGKHVIMNSGGIYFREGSTSLAHFSPEYLNLGKFAEGCGNVLIRADSGNNNGLYVRNYTTTLAKFTPAETVIGEVGSGKRNVQITNTGVQIRNNTGVIAKFSDGVYIYNGANPYLFVGTESNTPLVRIGYSSNINTVIDSAGMSIRDGSKIMGLFTASGLHYGVNVAYPFLKLGNGPYLTISGSSSSVSIEAASTVDGLGIHLSGASKGSYKYYYDYMIYSPPDQEAGNVVSGLYLSAAKGTNATNITSESSINVKVDKILLRSSDYFVLNPSKFRAAIGAAASSDIRLKRNAMPLDNEAVDFIREIRPIAYRIHDRREVGLSAQSIAAADKWGTDMAFMTDEGLDEWEKMEDGSKTWKLDYIRIIPPIVRTLQKILDRLDILETRMNALSKGETE